MPREDKQALFSEKECLENPWSSVLAGKCAQIVGQRLSKAAVEIFDISKTSSYHAPQVVERVKIFETFLDFIG